MPLTFPTFGILHLLWGGQSCPQPPFRRLFRPSRRLSEPAESRLQPRLAAPRCWFAIFAAPLLASAASPFAGDLVCAQCHREQAARYRATPMAQALESAPRCDILKQHTDLTFQEGAYQSRITRDGERALL